MGRDGNGPLLTDRAQQALLDALRDGTLRDGQFVSLKQLVEMLGLPIAAIREAVGHAASLGLLTTFPKRGLQIMDATPQSIRECLDFRAVLDVEGARRRIAGNALDGLQALRARHEQMRAAAQVDAGRDLPPKAIRVDLSLHDYLADGLGNARLQAAYDANRLRIAIIQNARPFLQDRIASAMDEHLAIIDALDRRDPDAAASAIRHHYAQTLRWWGAA